MTASNLAIYYHPDGYDTKNRPLMGRRAAGKAFLDAWFDRRGGGETFCLAARQEDFGHFVEHARNRKATGQAQWLPLDRLETVARVGTLYFPGPDIGLNAWRRFRRDPVGFSIIGVTHTICTRAVLDGMTEWLTAPVENYDAVICTSNAVRISVEQVLAAQREHLSRRNGATRFPQPQLPIIPLGVNTAEFAPDEDLRQRTRKQLGIGDDDVAFLFVGRLSIYGKAHPGPMFIALERAAQRSTRRLHLILAGWFATKGIEQSFLESAKSLCPSVKVHVVDGRNDAARGGAWRAGDVFVSLVDNIQETFGLTPVEAMAAGLPAVVSDWDGYRDTIRHGVDGFRIPTLLAPPALGEALMDRYAADIDSYDLYLARSTYGVAVDVEATVDAFVRLADDGELRRRMGEAGRARARAIYDWQVILGQYEQLAAALGEARQSAARPDAATRRVWPARQSPYEMFQNYTTRTPQRTDRVSLAVDDVESALAAVLADINAGLDDRAWLEPRLRSVAAELGREPKVLESLLATIDPPARMQKIALLLRLAKFGVIAIAPQEEKAMPRKGPADP